MFFYFGFLCLQVSSVSNFFPDIRGQRWSFIYLGSLVQSCCGEGGTLQTNITGSCGECSQCLGHTRFAPTHSVWATLGWPPFTACVPLQSTLLKLQDALQENCLKRALGCRHFPGLSHSGSGSRVLHKGTDSVGPVFCALPRSEQLRQKSP